MSARKKWGYWPIGSRERERLDDEPTHGEPSTPAAEHVATLAESRVAGRMYEIRGTRRMAAWAELEWPFTEEEAREALLWGDEDSTPYSVEVDEIVEAS